MSLHLPSQAQAVTDTKGLMTQFSIIQLAVPLRQPPELCLQTCATMPCSAQSSYCYLSVHMDVTVSKILRLFLIFFHSLFIQYKIRRCTLQEETKTNISLHPFPLASQA